MTPRDIALVQNTFSWIAPKADQAAALFYARLFELDPALREVFCSDMRCQGRKLMRFVTATVAALDRFDGLVPALRRFGARHALRGLRVEHYATIGVAAVWTLERLLGTALTPAARTAWTSTYLALANAMIDGATALDRAA